MSIAPYHYAQPYWPPFGPGASRYPSHHKAKGYHSDYDEGIDARNTHSLWAFHPPPDPYGHLQSRPNRELTMFQHHSMPTSRKHSTASLNYHRPRSESISLPGHHHYHSQNEDIAAIPASSMPHRSIRRRISHPQFPSTGSRDMVTSTHTLCPCDSSLWSDWMAVQEPPRVQFILPALLHTYLRDPPFRMSVKNGISSDLADSHGPYLFQPATKPAVPFLLITTPLLPWPIRLCVRPIASYPSRTFDENPPSYLSVQQVLNGICASLREYITVKEYELLASNKAFCDSVVGAYRRRKAQEARFKTPGFREPMRRVDWLAGRTIFEGLEESNARDGEWQLRLGWSSKVYY